MEDLIVQNLSAIISAVVAVSGAIVSITAFIKSLKSEKRTRIETNQLRNDVKITREGITQGFKDAVITKDLKVSVNNQVTKILDNGLGEIMAEIKKHEKKRTEMNYWTLKILEYTAASGKLTKEEKAELRELLASIREEEQIIDTMV